MTKQYVRYICKHIIFSIIIWLCVFGGGAIATTTTNIETFNYYSGRCDTWKPTDNEWIGYTTLTFNGYGGTWTAQTRITVYENGDNCEVGNYIASIYKNSTGIYIYEPYGSFKTTGFMYVYGSTSGAQSGSSDQVVSTTRAFYDEDFYTLSGDICNTNTASLYYDSGGWILLDEKDVTGDSVYSFDIMNTTNYKICIDGNCHEFTCTGDETYDYDLCDYQILHYVDDCANLLKNPCINIIVNDDYSNPLIFDGSSHTDVFMVGDDIQLNDKLDIWIGTNQGEQYRRLYAEIGEDWLYHKTKSWDLDVRVYDVNTSGYVSGAKVSVKQECRINDYQPYTFGITNLYGYVKTFDLSNQPYQVKVEKEGYNTFGYSTINAGFDAQHTNIPLSIYIQDTTKGDSNGTIGDPPNGGEGGGGDTVLPQTECSILWTDNDTKSITEINNTQGARLYFMAPNCSATLYIESRNTNTHVWDVETYIGLSPLQTGYSQIIPSDWIYPETKRYRGRLYAYDCGCDATDDLKVWHTNDPNITIIANLSAYVWFRHTIGGSYINPSSPIHILSDAASNNTTLLNINLQLFNESVKVDEISYTFFDYYDGGSFNPIKWAPNYEFTAGYNYCVYMYSNDILVDCDTVFANATGDNPFDTGNALTVKVYDQSSYPLQYSTVYVESWGTLDTGATNEVIFTGLGDDTYEYRAIKGGYLDRGFYSITLTSDATVSYILDIIDTEHAVRDIRLSDNEIKDMLVPVVFFILILLLVGVLIDAVN